MNRILYLIISIYILGGCAGTSQKNIRKNSLTQVSNGVVAPKKYGYKPSKTLKNDIIHTKLELKPDWDKKQMSGKATLTIKPYFYPQGTLQLDAKGFEILSVVLQSAGATKPLTYTYDKKILDITLDQTYTKDQSYVISIAYVAKPEELKTTAGDAISSDKGLFFISPDSTNPDKPRQLWTQGEPESSSCWFPTIDSPNEKSTQELIVTVENKYKTLSNGVLISSINHPDQTRTDYWKQSLPHSPYLFVLAIGEFAVVKDKWNGLDIQYFVEPAYEKHAKAIFGNTPEMMTFFSKKLNYKYPWEKYASVVVRDYVSGAMENTSATVFMEQLQRTDRELLDQNWDNIIAHELFHHWFGDLVTAESWANLPLNESFANYSEYLWEEYKRGQDAAEYMRQGEIDQYMYEAERKREPIIRYHYKDPEDMFDSHSYSKGGAILHMLRKYVGDEAFFEALSLYLHKNQYKTAEVHQLRMAFEEITGEDLQWFFNQWFLSPGHPELKITEKYLSKELTLTVEQIQDTAYTPVYKLPVQIDIWVKGVKQTKAVTISAKKEKFTFALDTLPDLVLFDAEQQLLGSVIHRKSMNQYIFQYKHAGKYLARQQALDRLYDVRDSLKVFEAMVDALQDPFWKPRETAIEYLSKYKSGDTLMVQKYLNALALNEKNKSVRALAISKLGALKKPAYEQVFVKGLSDSAYSVVAASLLAYLKLEPKDADAKLDMFINENNEDIVESIAEYYVLKEDTTKLNWFKNRFKNNKNNGLYSLIQNFGRYSKKLNQSQQKEALVILEQYARTHPYNWIRYAAFQSLEYLDKIVEIKEIKKDIKSKEKNDRLIELYGMIE